MRAEKNCWESQFYNLQNNTENIYEHHTTEVFQLIFNFEKVSVFLFSYRSSGTTSSGHIKMLFYIVAIK